MWNVSGYAFCHVGPDTTNRKVVLGRLSEVGMKPTIVYESNNVLLIDQMIQGGVGVGFLPDAYCRPNQHRVYFSLNPPLTCAIGTIYRKMSGSPGPSAISLT